MNTKYVISFFIIMIFSSCSLAPLNSPNSARTLGKDNNEIIVTPLLSQRVSYARGISEDFDLSFSLEGQFGPQASMWAKYALVNNREKGFSLSALAGGFYTLDPASTHGFTAGSIMSWKLDWFEPYFLTRYNYVTWDSVEVLGNKGDYDYFDFTTPRTNFYYFQSTLGFNFWTSPTFAFGINASVFYAGAMVFDDSISVFPQIDLMWHF